MKKDTDPVMSFISFGQSGIWQDKNRQIFVDFQILKNGQREFFSRGSLVEESLGHL